MAKFAIVWMWEANYSEKPLIVEAETAEKALTNYRMHSIYGDKFWQTAKVFAFPAEGVRWMGNRPPEPVVPVRPDGSVPELSKPEPSMKEIEVLPPIGELLSRTRTAMAKFEEAKATRRRFTHLQEEIATMDAASNEALDQFRWRAMEYVEMLLTKFPETKED